MDFDKLMNNIMSPKVFEQGNTPELRASGAPFCPKRYVYSYIEYLNGNSKWDFFGSFYCDIGTAIHSAIQYWLPIANEGDIIGSWYCRKCKIVESYKVGPIKCQRCGKYMEYGEIIVVFPGCMLVGHSDGLLIDKKFIHKTYGKLKPHQINDLILNKSLKDKIPAWVLEYKSTGIYNCKNIKAPYDHHVRQASLYSMAISRMPQFKSLQIEGCIIKYISRDNPRVKSPDLKVTIKDDKLYKDTCKLVNTIVEMFTTLRVKKVYNIDFCTILPYFDECEYKDLCNDISFKDFKLMTTQVAEHWSKRPHNFMAKHKLF